MAKILIIEDEHDLSELYKMVLSAGGHEIVGTFIDPREPLKQSEGSLDPDVIILDERLGGNSGLAHFRAYREKFPKAKIMVATADPDAIDEARAEEVDLAKKKPFPMSDLLEDIYRLTRDS